MPDGIFRPPYRDFKISPVHVFDTAEPKLIL